MGLDRFYKAWFSGVPKNAKKASQILTFGGAVSDGQTVTIGSNVYEFDNNDNITLGNIKVDMIPYLPKASGTLTFTDTASDGETVVIGTEIYEFDTNESVGTDNILVDISKAETIDDTISALVNAINENSEIVTAVGDNEEAAIVVTALAGGTAGNSIATTTTCINASWGESETLADGADTLVETQAVLVLALVINGNPNEICEAMVDSKKLIVSYKFVGTEGNGIVVSETCTNAEWVDNELEGGQYATPARTAGYIIINGVFYICYKPVDKWDIDGWYSATPNLL